MELKVRLKDQAPHALARGAFVGLTLRTGGPCVKATSRSPTARPQEGKPHREEAPLGAVSNHEPAPSFETPAKRGAPQDEGGAINARYGSFSSPRALPAWRCPETSISRSRTACRRSLRGSRPC